MIQRVPSALTELFNLFCRDIELVEHDKVSLSHTKHNFSFQVYVWTANYPKKKLFEQTRNTTAHGKYGHVTLERELCVLNLLCSTSWDAKHGP